MISLNEGCIKVRGKHFLFPIFRGVETSMRSGRGIFFYGLKGEEVRKGVLPEL